VRRGWVRRVEVRRVGVWQVYYGLVPCALVWCGRYGGACFAKVRSGVARCGVAG